MTFKDLYLSFYDYQSDKVRESTIKTYRDRVKYLQYFDNIKLKDFNINHFELWKKEIVGYGLTTKKGSINSYHDGLKQVLKRIKKEQTDDLIILHTNQGSVYSSKAYNKLLENYNISRSMSRAGTPTDNPVNESLNGWIKEELIVDFDLKNSKDVPKLIEEYIYYYNNERPSYALNYKTPIQYKIESGF
jgi:putative transposase